MYSRVVPPTSMLARPLVRPAGLPQPALGAGSRVPPLPVAPEGDGVSPSSTRVTLPSPSPLDGLTPPGAAGASVPAAGAPGLLPAGVAGAASEAATPPTTERRASELSHDAASRNVARATRAGPRELPWRAMSRAYELAPRGTSALRRGLGHCRQTRCAGVQARAGTPPGLRYFASLSTAEPSSLAQ